MSRQEGAYHTTVNGQSSLLHAISSNTAHTHRNTNKPGTRAALQHLLESELHRFRGMYRTFPVKVVVFLIAHDHMHINVRECKNVEMHVSIDTIRWK